MTDEQEVLLRRYAALLTGDDGMVTAVNAALDELARLRRGPAALMPGLGPAEWHAFEDHPQPEDLDAMPGKPWYPVQSWVWHPKPEGEGS